MEQELGFLLKSADSNAEKAEREGKLCYISDQWTSKSCQRQGKKSGGFGETAYWQTPRTEIPILKHLNRCTMQLFPFGEFLSLYFNYFSGFFFNRKTFQSTVLLICTVYSIWNFWICTCCTFLSCFAHVFFKLPPKTWETIYSGG